MLKVGITGGIGSGKSTVCKVFEVLGIPIYYADDRAKYLMQNDTVLREKIKNYFGNDIYLDNQLNKKVLAEKVFNNKQALEKLTSLVHPAVFIDISDWYSEHAKEAYTLQEAALLIETESYKLLDKLIVVHAPVQERVERVMKRDSVTEAEVLARMKNQLPEVQKVELADYVINNFNDESLINQVIPIHKELLALSKKKQAQ